MQDGPVERGCGGRGDVHGVHGAVHVGLGHGGASGAAPALGEGVLLGALGVVGLGGTPALAGARGQRLAPLLVVALVVLAELVLVVEVVDDAQLHAEQPQALRDRVDGRGRDNQQPEDREQHEQGYGEDLAHRVRQRGRHAPADEPAGVPYGLHAVAARGRAAGDVDLTEHADDERGQADHDAAVGLGLLRVPDETHRDHREQYRHEQVETAEGAGHQDLDEVADRAAQIRPGAGGDDQREAEQQERYAVLAVGRVQVLRALPYAAEHRADGVRGAEPDGAHELDDAPGGAGSGLGAGRAVLLATAFFAGALFAAAFFAGAFAGAALLAGCFLAAEGREAIGVRLPVEAAGDTCVRCFTRSCRPYRTGNRRPLTHNCARGGRQFCDGTEFAPLPVPGSRASSALRSPVSLRSR